MTLDELDGVAVAPANHHVLFENDEVRVLEITIAAGTTTPVHTHRAPTVLYKLSGSHFVRRDDQGETLFDSRCRPRLRAAEGLVQRAVAAAHDREHRR